MHNNSHLLNLKTHNAIKKSLQVTLRINFVLRYHKKIKIHLKNGSVSKLFAVPTIQQVHF